MKKLGLNEFKYFKIVKIRLKLNQIFQLDLI